MQYERYKQPLTNCDRPGGPGTGDVVGSSSQVVVVKNSGLTSSDSELIARAKSHGVDVVVVNTGSDAHCDPVLEREYERAMDFKKGFEAQPFIPRVTDEPKPPTPKPVHTDPAPPLRQRKKRLAKLQSRKRIKS